VYYRPVFTRRLMPSVTDGTSIVCAGVLLRHISWLLQLQPCITVGYYKGRPAGGVGVRWVRTQCRPKPYDASDALRLQLVCHLPARTEQIYLCFGRSKAKTAFSFRVSSLLTTDQGLCRARTPLWAKLPDPIIGSRSALAIFSRNEPAYKIHFCIL